MATIIKLKRGTTTPTTGDLANGEVAIDTSAQKFYINDSGSIKEIGGGTALEAAALGGDVRSYTGDGSTVAYTVSTGADVENVLVFINGVYQRPTTDYTVSGSTLTFGTAPTNGDSITIKELVEGINSLSFTDDSSTVTTLNTGETLKIAGGSNVTTSISGDTLTINSTASGNLTVADDSSTTTTLDIANDTFKIAGGTGITTSLSGDTLTITGSAVGSSFTTINLNDSTNIVADSASDTLNLDSSGLISITGDASTDTVTVGTVSTAAIPFLKSDGSSSNIDLQTSGTIGEVLQNLYIPFTIADGTAIETLVVGSS
jgi:hypothetical protein